MLGISSSNLAISRGFDRHIWDLDLVGNVEGVVNSRKYVLAIECTFCVASGFIKVSILLFYRRLSSRVVSNTFRWTTWISIGFIVAYSIALTLAPILGCQPISAFWDQVDARKILKGYRYTCFDEGADVLVASIISVVQDFITALLPTFLYWNLQVPFRQKVALFGIFAIGYGVVALGGLRVYYTWRTFYQTYDVTWSTWDLMLTTLLELHIGCFCANLPALKVFFKHFFQETLTSRSRTKTPVDSAHSGTKSSISKSVLRKVASFISNGSRTRSTDGYISEPHSKVGVDHYGGVQIRKEVHVTHSPPCSINHSKGSRRTEFVTTTDLIYDHYYDDIELGRYTTGHNSQASSMRSTKIIEGTDLSALPPIPKSPKSRLSTKSLWSLGSCSHLQTMKELPPPPPLPASAPKVEPVKERRLTPFVLQSLNQKGLDGLPSPESEIQDGLKR